jgi:ATP-binding cassette, subfamily B (MDR/TAP), member 1
MDLIFGKFVTAFNNFALGRLSPAQYMDRVDQFSWGIPSSVVCFIQINDAGIQTVLCLPVHRQVCLGIYGQHLHRHFRNSDYKGPSRRLCPIPTLPGDQFLRFERRWISLCQIHDERKPSTQGISEKLFITVQSCAAFFAAFIIGFAVQWKLTLIMFSVVPFILIAMGASASIYVKQEARVMAIYSKAGLLAEEVFSSITTVHAFWLQPLMAKRYDALLEDAQRE